MPDEKVEEKVPRPFNLARSDVDDEQVVVGTSSTTMRNARSRTVQVFVHSYNVFYLVRPLT